MRKTIIATTILTANVAGLSTLALGDVVYDGFASTAGLTINGHAAITTTSDGVVLRVTPTGTSRAGSAFSIIPVSTEQFTSVFSFRITDNGGPIWDNNTSNGADGIVFVVQNVANNVGAAGSGIGYGGIGTSVGVEYDTWGNDGQNDPSQSHIGINFYGNVNHNAPGQGPFVNIGNTNAPTTALPGPELDSGDRWWSWVFYDGAKMDVYLKQDESATVPFRPATPLLTHNFDLQSTLGGSTTAFVGFTSATGLDWSNHDVIFWSYTESIPEPASLSILALGSVMLLRRR